MVENKQDKSQKYSEFETDYVSYNGSFTFPRVVSNQYKFLGGEGVVCKVLTAEYIDGNEPNKQLEKLIGHTFFVNVKGHKGDEFEGKFSPGLISVSCCRLRLSIEDVVREKN